MTVIVFLPVAGGLVALAAHRRPQLCRWLALVVSLIELSLLAWLAGSTSASASQGPWLLTENYVWIESLGIHFNLGLDGISLVLSLLTAFLIFLSILVSWKQVHTKSASFHFLLLLTESSVLGLFMARDLFLFYLFWEIQVIPLFFIIGIWGHQNRIRAASKFLIVTVGASLLMFIALISVYLLQGQQSGIYTFALDQLISTPLPAGRQLWLYAAFLLAIGVKVPVLPVHFWLPDTHTEAPTAGSVVLAGILLKTGVFALFRIAFPLFPLAAAASTPLLMALGLAGLFYAGWIAFSQSDIKRLTAYSSIAHMGLIVLGLALWTNLTIHGAWLQMINHGLSTSALFIMIGMLGERVESREMKDLGGLWKQMPIFGVFFMLFAMSAMGLPGLNNFVGELLILVGAFASHPMVAVLGFAGMVLTLLYILRMVQGVLLGPARSDLEVWDVTSREFLILGLLAVAVLAIGLHPGPLLEYFDAPVREILVNGPGLAGR